MNLRSIKIPKEILSFSLEILELNLTRCFCFTYSSAEISPLTIPFTVNFLQIPYAIALQHNELRLLHRLS